MGIRAFLTIPVTFSSESSTCSRVHHIQLKGKDTELPSHRPVQTKSLGDPNIMTLAGRRFDEIIEIGHDDGGTPKLLHSLPLAAKSELILTHC